MPQQRKDSDSACQIMRTMDVVGEKWSLLIVRDAMRGLTRFSEFRDSLGAPTDVLSARLSSLVQAGILEKREYREAGSRTRAAYHLTEMGRGLNVVIAAMVQWTDRFNPSPAGAGSIIVDQDGAPVSLALQSEAGDDVPFDEMAIHPGPAGTWTLSAA
jgi:DNA-binding HxlR family transcriptional regulator